MLIATKIKFEGAKLIVGNKRDPYDTCDYVVTEEDMLSKKEYRATPRNTKELVVDRDGDIIVFSPINGMLHAIMGEIPPKRYGGFGIQPIEEITNCARNGVFKIYNEYFYYDKNGKRRLITETSQARKFNKYTRPKKDPTFVNFKGVETNIHFTWNAVRERFLMKADKRHNAVTYNNFINKLEELSGVNCRDTSITFSEVFDIIRNNEAKRDELAQYIKDGRLGNDYIHFLNDETYDCASTRYNSLPDAYLVKTYIQKRVTLNGEFIFWLTEEQHNKIMCCGRCATYLDGGIAYVSDDICYTREYYIENGYTPIKDLNY